MFYFPRREYYQRIGNIVYGPAIFFIDVYI